MSADAPKLQIGGSGISGQLADHGTTTIPVALQLLKNGQPTTHRFTGDMLAGMLGVQGTSAMQLTGISMQGSHSNSSATLAVGVKQIGPSGASYPIQGTERHIHAKANSDGTTSLVAAHAIVPPGGFQNAVVEHKFNSKLPAVDGAPSFKDPHCDAQLAMRHQDWTDHFDISAEDIMKTPGVTIAERTNPDNTTEKRVAISLAPAHNEHPLPKLAQKHRDNPTVLATVFAGSTGEPVSLVDPETGLEAPHIVCSHAAASNAAGQLSENMQAPFGHYGLEFQTHVVDGAVDDDDTATLNLAFNRAAMTMDGHEGGALHASDVANKIGMSLAPPGEPVSKAKQSEYKDAFSAGLFAAPVKSAAPPPPATVVTLSGGGASGLGDGADNGEGLSDDE